MRITPVGFWLFDQLTLDHLRREFHALVDQTGKTGENKLVSLGEFQLSYGTANIEICSNKMGFVVADWVELTLTDKKEF